MVYSMAIWLFCQEVFLNAVSGWTKSLVEVDSLFGRDFDRVLMGGTMVAYPTNALVVGDIPAFISRMGLS